MTDRHDFQSEDLRNITTRDEFYERLSAGKILDNSNTSQPAVQYIPVPLPLRGQLGSPTALAIGAFATTLTTLSCALMGLRGVSTTNAFVGDFLGVAGIAFGLFYAGFGFIVSPFFGVAAAYGGAHTAEYNNALGFFVLLWAVFNIFFLIGSLPLNLVYIGIFLTVQLAFTLVAAGYFLTADGRMVEAKSVNTAGGACAFASGMLGFYTVGNLMCQEATAPFGFTWPMGDTSRFFRKKLPGLDRKESPSPAAATKETS